LSGERLDGGYREVVAAARAPDATGMPAPVRAKMERAFAADFSQVRVHPDSSSADALRAQAFTQGDHVHIAPGRWAPHTPTGQQLLGHELAHVVQQRAGRVAATRQMKGAALNDDPALEREADELGARAAAGQHAGHPPCAACAPAGAPIQRLAHDFEIRGKEPDTAAFPSFIFFTEGSAALDAVEQGKIPALAAPAGAMLTLHGYASEEGAAAGNAAMSSARLAAVKTKLVAAGHDPAKVTTVAEPGKGKGNIEYRHMRSVEVVRPGGASSVPPAPASLPCAGADETAFVDGEGEAEAMIDKATAALTPPIGPAMTGLLTRFFGGAAIAPTVKSNLVDIKAQLGRLTPATHHLCANASVAGCAGSDAFNMGVGAAAVMTLCQNFLRDPSKKSRGGTLLHEAAHGTPGLITKDKSYAHVRQIEFLSLADALVNSDSYALLVRLFDVPGSMTVGVPDPMPGLSVPEQTAAKRSVAWLETWLVAAYQELSSLYETIHDSIAAGAWTNGFYKASMALVAPIFGLTAPPAVPTTKDKIRIAAVHDRCHTMRETMHSTPVTVSKGLADHWAPGPGASVAVSPAFFADTPPLQLRRLLEAIIVATPDISPGFVSKYLDVIDKIRTHGGVGSP
jgi:outer membrane protein OmpA-like peptidoglycan-associated protein